MSVKVAAWNVQERLAIPGKSRQVVEAVNQLDADVVMLSDAMWLGNPLHDATVDLGSAAIEAFAREGYHTYPVDYGDREGHYRDRYHLAMSRLPETEFGEIHAGFTNMPLAKVNDPSTELSLNIFGVHLDDADEYMRLSQSKDLIKAAESIRVPAAMVGDFNDMPSNSAVSRLLRMPPANNLINRMPDLKARNDYEEINGRKAKLKRLLGMSYGSALSVFQEAGYSEADPKRTATFPAKKPIVQLDHILHTPGVISRNFKRHKLSEPVSDHCAISAEIEPVN